MIAVGSVFYQCAKAIVRSKLWDSATQVERSTLPTTVKILAELTASKIDADARCTLEDDQLFSHRRARPTGRFAGVTWWEYDRP